MRRTRRSGAGSVCGAPVRQVQHPNEIGQGYDEQRECDQAPADVHAYAMVCLDITGACQAMSAVQSYSAAQQHSNAVTVFVL